MLTRYQLILEPDRPCAIGPEWGYRLYAALRFQTPTAFKSRGQYVNLPTTRLLMQSLVQKWNGSFLDCPIEDEDGLGVASVRIIKE